MHFPRCLCFWLLCNSWCGLAVLNEDRQLSERGRDGDNATSVNVSSAETGQKDDKKHDMEIETQLNNFMQPHSLQPFYFIPISSCVIVVLQFSIFGFSIKFKPAEAECCIYKKCVNRLKSLAKELGTIAFILLALVTWRHDVLKWKAMPAEDQLETFCYFLVVLVTSPNTKAALAHFAILRVQSPTAVFGVNPKYRSLPGCGIPVFPCTASWMTPLQWLYTMILLPYEILWMIHSWFTRMLPDCCTPGLLPVIGAAVKPVGTWFLCVGPIFIFPFWLLLVAMSLGLWSYARSKLIWWWGMSWPFWAMILLQFWAVFVCILFAIIYLVYVILTGGVQPIHSTKKNAKDLQVEQQALWNLQPQAVQEDFFLPVGQSGVETQQGEAHALEAQLSVAEDAHALEEQQIVPDLTTLTAGLKCQIVSAALAIQANYAVLQLFVIVFCRLLLHSDSEKNAVNAYKTTISERHIATYMDYLNSLVTQADAAVGFSALVRLWCRQAYAAWNVL
ncbi:unnamed protein product [Cladocopium goreaui]|uniref:Glucosylceramidase n=1 Tax=Cladocopium goreaui TaxID=2562237 RepID=A0A9P1CXY2_9DINO|nr:unnamed protein product [Cladocopium goreaui]|mmetsp:Transcript_31637/g.65278  ORF Transcript_31637/g.65278 Transcript_31637/m.65278 type:complete len:504 (+) Transcript_31637:39-1550(+)